jgi:fibro-slime domain-containing protein
MRSPKQSKVLIYSFSVAAAAAFGACKFEPGEPGSQSPIGSPGTGGNSGGTAGVFGMSMPPQSGTAGSSTGGGTNGPVTIPSDFTRAEIGAWKLGNPISATGAPPSIDSPPGGCNRILGVVRDFQGAGNPEMGHPDFETYSGGGATTGLVATDLGADRKPVYASMCEMGNVIGACPHGPQTTSADFFKPWYRTTDPTNKAFEIYFILEPNEGKTTFRSTSFFPLDNAAGSFGNAGRGHNFHFTTELHTKFKYRGGETFAFEGDDDLWVFVNKKLALDLGGLHPQVNGMIDMDAQAAALGITKGNVYDLELFHAERHTNQSNFRVDTNFVFVDCGTVIP